MKALTQIILFTAAIMTTSVVGAGVYKYIDENGNVAYGDKPVEGSEKVKIRNTRQSSSSDDSSDDERAEDESGGSREESASSNDEESNEPAVKYKELSILTPKQGKIISDRAGSVQVIFLPTPPLGRSDVIVISIDGKDVSKGRDANLSLQNMQRGTHTVVGRILDSNGKTKIQSKTVSFEVKSPSK